MSIDMEKTYPKADQIQKDFCKKLCGLQTFMNVYSFTLRLGLLTEEEFDQLYSTITKMSDIALSRFYKEDKQ